MPTVCHVAPRYTKYGTNGYVVHAVGHENVFFATMKLVNEWAKSHGLEVIRL